MAATEAPESKEGPTRFLGLAQGTGEPGPGRTPAAPAEVALVVPMPQVRSRAQIVAEALKHGLI